MGSKVNWPRSNFTELHELCGRLNIRLDFDPDRNLYAIVAPASDDDEIFIRLTCPKALYSMLKQRDINRSLERWQQLLQQGKLQRDTLEHADMTSSIGHLTNPNVSDHITRFITKGRLQLLETSAVNNVYYPQTYERGCRLCRFRTDTNSHALNGCRRLKGLYSERHNRCVELVGRELKRIMTNNCELYQNQPITVNGHAIDSARPDLCLIDHGHAVARIIEISNPFDTFLDQCYEHKFNKYSPLCERLSQSGFHTKIVVLVIGSLGTVHRRVVSGLTLVGLDKRRSKNLAKYLSMSVMIGSRRAWARRGYSLAGESL